MGSTWFSVLFARSSTRKHKKWEFDGFLECKSDQESVLWDEKRKSAVSRCLLSQPEITAIEDHDELSFGAFDVQIVAPFSNNADTSPKPAMMPIMAKKRSLSGTQQNGPLAKNRRGFVSPLTVPVERLLAANWFVDENESGPHRGVVESRIAASLRDHQRIGVQFIYRRLKAAPGGAILADEMGLGKSIQTIAACLALQKNVELGIRKILIAVPSSLPNSGLLLFVLNCAVEATACRTTGDIGTYCAGNHERLAAVQFDVIVCDEAHRLKNPDAKLRVALESIAARRRLLLTGTPLQNELSELFALLDFACPGFVESQAAFIKMSREPARRHDAATKLGSDCISAASEKFVRYFRPSPLQIELMEALCEDMFADALVTITHLRTVANHPVLFLRKAVADEFKPQVQAVCEHYSGVNIGTTEHSGKLMVLTSLLASFARANERVIVFSNFTQTLDMLEMLCNCLNYTVRRLDGSVPSKERQKIVNEFNASAQCCSILLMSTKAGGVGLNLVGASRLVLFDSDWNPANDQQAMARIWRDGQTKPCLIYRLILAGTIDEKILQRQVKKTGLHAVFDQEMLSSFDLPFFRMRVLETAEFDDDDLKEIFEECHTHVLMACRCGGNGTSVAERSDEDNEGEECLSGSDECKEETKSDKLSLCELAAWRHFSRSNEEAFGLLLQAAEIDAETATSALSFGMQFSSRLS